MTTKLRALVALVFCALTLTWLVAARTNSVVGAQGPPQGDAPVEQTRKNIQVLKGLPEAQLFPLMNFISTSLGVRCGFCHVQTKDPKTGRDQWDWASDDKENKQAARRMMLMTMSINKTNKIDLGSTGVTCYTCHRGASNPVNLPPLPLTASGHEPPPGPPQGGAAPGGPQQAGAAPGGAPQARPTPPTPQQIIDKYVAAVGGRDAVAKVQSRVLKGTREASQGRNWPIEVTLKGPDKFVVVASTPEGEVVQSYNGTTGWLSNPQGAHAASAQDLTALKNTAAIFNVLQLTAPTPTMRFAGRAKIGDRETFVLRDTPAPGVIERLFFDRETGLLLRRLTLTETVLNPLPEQIDFEDYRDVDGVKVPFTIMSSNIDTYYSSTRKFTDIKHNVPVDDARFQMPPPKPKP
ncbi:MAG TPA: c-type cytochrome [Pyrinomonadaceae bacterium]|jgi:outer membrane lipoprotein-sorting protein